MECMVAVVAEHAQPVAGGPRRALAAIPRLPAHAPTPHQQYMARARSPFTDGRTHAHTHCFTCASRFLYHASPPTTQASLPTIAAARSSPPKTYSSPLQLVDSYQYPFAPFLSHPPSRTQQVPSTLAPSAFVESRFRMKLSLSRHPTPHPPPPAMNNGDASTSVLSGTDLEHALSAAFDQMLSQRHPAPHRHPSSPPSQVSFTPLSLPSRHHQSRTTLPGVIPAASRPIAVYEPTPAALRDMSALHRQLKHSSKIQQSSSSTRQYMDASGRRSCRRRKGRSLKTGFSPSSVFPPMTRSTDSFACDGGKSWAEDAAVTMQYLQTHPTPSSSAGGPSQTTSDTSSIYPASTPPSSPTFSNSTPQQRKRMDRLTDRAAVAEQAVGENHFIPESRHVGLSFVHTAQGVRRHPPTTQQGGARRYRKSRILANNNFFLPPLFADDPLLNSPRLPYHDVGSSGGSRVLDLHETITFKDFQTRRAHPILTLCSSPKAVEPLSEQPPTTLPSKVSPLVAATTALKAIFFAKSNSHKPAEKGIEEPSATPAQDIWRANVLTQAVVQCLDTPPDSLAQEQRPRLTSRASKQTLRAINQHSRGTVSTNKGPIGTPIGLPRGLDSSSSSFSDDREDEGDSCAQSDASEQDKAEGQGANASSSHALPHPHPIDVISSLRNRTNDDSFDQSSSISSHNMFEHSVDDSQSSITCSEQSDTLSSLWRALADPTKPPSDHIPGKTVLEELVFGNDNLNFDGNDHSLSRVMDWRTKVQTQEVSGQVRGSVVSQ